MTHRRLLVAYVLLNSVLYSVLLPLWEGFDEPFHFGYVQQIANGGGFPDPRTARLSGEVAASLLLAPASDAVKRNLPQVTSYEEYFSCQASKRTEARRKLYGIPTAERWRQSQFLNYEAHQAPLAHLLLAPFERLLAREPMPSRVAILRFAAAASAGILLLWGADRLFSQLRIPEVFRAAALFCVFSSQMTWATLAHIGNDWLAVPLAVWVLHALIRYRNSPSLRSAALAAALLSAGLLTKAYFLALLPLPVVLCVRHKRWRELAIATAELCVLAGPWYLRNWLRYGVLTATQESRAGVGVRAVLSAAATLRWPVVLRSSVHSALWTGNNTFAAFSASTENLLLGVGLVALLAWAATRHRSAEWITLSYCGCFAIALGYAAAASSVYSHGLSTTPSPWYAQVLAAPVLGLAFLGASRLGGFGRLVGACMAALFGYVLSATYAAKLIPLYSGFRGRASLLAVARLYAHGFSGLAGNLDSVTLAPACIVFALAVVTIGLAVSQVVLLVGLLAGGYRRRAVPGRPADPLHYRRGWADSWRGLSSRLSSLLSRESELLMSWNSG